MPVVQLRNKAVLESEPILELFRKAFTPPKEHKGVEFPDVEKALAWLKGVVEEDHIAVFVTHDAGRFTGLAICQDYPDPFSGRGWVLQYFCEVPEHSDQLAAAIGNWFFKVRNCPRLRILNFTGRSDRAHMRRFRKFAIGKRLAGLIEYSAI